MEKWLKPALDYVPRWIDYQMEQSGIPGCSIAVAHRGRIVLERAFGMADLRRKEKLTARHRFRAASHSKTFTATAIMRLRERRKLRLDDEIGKYVGGLDRKVAGATLAQLMSHS